MTSGLVSVDGTTVSTLVDYSNLKTQLAKASPSSTNAASYTATNTAAQKCPATGTSWNAATALPPTPNEELCGCMLSSLSCAVKSDISDDDIGSLFGTVCGLGKDVCDGITANGTTGDYGAYSMCNSTAQLSFVINNYVAGTSGATCDFNGQAETQDSVTPAGTCKALVSQAGTAGTGSVTSAPTGTGSSSSSSGSSSSSSSKSASGNLVVPKLDMMGMVPMATAIIGAFLTGVGMIML
jgi:1,3-beta-glucanosyltransferase GAS1